MQSQRLVDHTVEVGCIGEGLEFVVGAGFVEGVEFATEFLEDVRVLGEVVEDMGERCGCGVTAGYYYEAAVADEPSRGRC